jgi:hypothetical protein
MNSSMDSEAPASSAWRSAYLQLNQALTIDPDRVTDSTSRKIVNVSASPTLTHRSGDEAAGVASTTGAVSPCDRRTV